MSSSFFKGVYEMEQYLQVGVITTTHGVRGEVKVFPTTDDARRFAQLKYLYMESIPEYMRLDICGVKFFKNQVILKFKQFDSINDVEKYRGRALYVPRDQAVALEENEYYYADLIGIRVRLSNGSDGELTRIIETGANDVYEITLDGTGKKILIPAIRQCIRSVDIKKRLMEVELMDGLL